MKPIIAFFAAALLATAAAGQTDAVPVGSTVTLFVTSDGVPAPTLEWFKDGKPVGKGDKLELGVVTTAAAGTYTVKATNEVGSATSDPYLLAVLNVPAKPVIRIALKKPGELTVEVPAGTNVVTTPVSSGGKNSTATTKKQP